MRRVLLARGSAVSLAGMLVAGVASAQGQGGRHHGGASASGTVTGSASASGKGTQSMVLQQEQLGTAAFATVARTRMRNGDCAGALDAFDEAIRHSIDVTLRRDRGLCHDQLGHPYPAMDDYRAYLTEDPDAGDAESIREKLAKLEQQTSGASPSQSKSDDEDDVPPKESISAGVSAGGSANAGGAGSGTSAGASGGAEVSTMSGVSDGDQPDRMDWVEHDDDTLRSSLRRGKGFGLGAEIGFQQLFASGLPFSEPLSRAESVALQLRYSFPKTLGIVGEVGYVGFNSDDIASLSGFKALVGLELRIPLTETYDDQIFFRPGVELDLLSAGSSIANGTNGVDALVPQLRIGWRPMIAKSVGLEISADVGETKYVGSSDFPYGGNGPWATVAALNLGAAWGL